LSEKIKTVLAILASPRKLGNCELLVKEISRHIPEPHELKLIRLQSKNIKPCRACYACLEKGVCVLEDDCASIVDHLAAADGVILAAPCYLMGVNGVMKLFIDRGMQMFSRAEALLDKPAINIVTAGLAGEAGYTEMALNSFTMILGCRLQESAVFYGALPGEALWRKDEEQKKAATLGRRLFSAEPRQTETWRCPLCGSDAIQLLGGTRVQCYVCRNYGELSIKDAAVSLDMQVKPENIVYTAEQRRHHHAWLQQEKRRFMKTYREIRGFLGEYTNDGTWL